MSNEIDVAAAWLEILRDDTGTGSLVALTGKPDPGATWGDPEASDLPVIVLPDMPVSSVYRGAPYRRVQTWRPEVRVARGSQKLAGQLLDRLETVTTWSAFDALGLDVQVVYGTRTRGDPGEVGGYRFIADYRLTVTV